MGHYGCSSYPVNINSKREDCALFNTNSFFAAVCITGVFAPQTAYPTEYQGIDLYITAGRSLIILIKE